MEKPDTLEEEEEVENRKKIRIKNIDMSQEMKDAAIKCAKEAIDKYDIEQDIADYVRYEFDKHFSEELPEISKDGGAGWHCIVGRQFTSYVTHETKHFIFFYIG